MAIEKIEINYAKELADVFKLIKELVKCIKEKGDYTSLVDELVTAINGVDDIPAEFKADIEAFINTCAVETNGIVWALVEKPTFE